MARSRSFLTPRPRLPLLVFLAGLLLLPAWSPAPAAPQEPEATLLVDAPPCFATLAGQLGGSHPQVLAGRDPERATLGPDDIVTIDPAGATLAPGDRLEIFRALGPVQRPGGGELGEAILVLGELVVEDVADGRITAIVGDTCGEVEVGDRLRPAVERESLAAVPKPEFDPGQAVVPRPGDAAVVFGHVETVPDGQGGIGDSWAQISYGPGDVVTIDQGTADGWSAGQVALLYQHGPLYGDPPDYDEDAVVLLGTGVVISVRPDTSALLITGGDRAVRIGARVRRMPGD